MRFSRPLLTGLLVLAAQLSALAGEVAMLRNGFSIRHERREVIGEITRLHTDGGYVDVPTEQIVSFEKEELPLPQPETPAVVAATPAGAVAAPEAKLDIDQLVREAAEKRHIDPDFVSSLIKYESNFQPRALSNKGAQGLMQLMPKTAAQLGVSNAFDPKANVEAGTEYLSQLLDLYNNDPVKALAAYNAGAHRVEQYHGVPPFRETRLYINHIVRDFSQKKLAKGQMNGAQAPAQTIAQAKPATTAKPTAVASAKKSVLKSVARKKRVPTLQNPSGE